jgi:hypothetical protein
VRKFLSRRTEFDAPSSRANLPSGWATLNLNGE